MRSAQIQLKAGDSKNQALDFFAMSAVISNLGGQWVHFPDTGVYVEPYTLNAVVALPGVQTAQLDTDPPPTQVNTGTGQPASIIFSDQPQAASPGIAVQSTPSGTAALTTGFSGFITAPTGGNLVSSDQSSVFLPSISYEVTEMDVVLVPQSGAAAGAPFGAELFLGDSTAPNPGQVTFIAANIGGHATQNAYIQYKCHPPRVWVAPAQTFMHASVSCFGGSGTWVFNASLTLRERTR